MEEKMKEKMGGKKGNYMLFSEVKYFAPLLVRSRCPARIYPANVHREPQSHKMKQPSKESMKMGTACRLLNSEKSPGEEKTGQFYSRLIPISHSENKIVMCLKPG